MIYGAALDGRDLDVLVVSVNSESQTDDGEEEKSAEVSPPPASQPQPKTEPNAPQSAVRQERSAAAIQSPSTIPRTEPGSSGNHQRDPIHVLRNEAFQLADVAAQLLGCDGMITPIASGLGFLVGPVPAEVRESIPITQRPALLCAWWLLVTVSEQFASLRRTC